MKGAILEIFLLTIQFSEMHVFIKKKKNKNKNGCKWIA